MLLAQRTAIPLFTVSLLRAPIARSQTSAVALEPCHADRVPVVLRCGTYWVYENRGQHRGRRIPLFVRIIPSSRDNGGAPSPASISPLVFVSAGGPGITNSDIVSYAYNRGWRLDRDVVLVDLRGTSGPNRLDCKTARSDSQPLAYLKSQFDTRLVASCRDALSPQADLAEYTTANAMDDLYDALRALGYSHVNLWGASGGTREVLEFIRRHPRIVRAAIVEGVAPVTFKNPLPQAEAAQEALDSLFAQCVRDAQCNEAFPNLRQDFVVVRDSLRAHSLRVTVPPGLSSGDSTFELTWPVFAEGIREMSYTALSERSLPWVIHRASTGDFAPFLNAAVPASRRTADAIRFGFLLSQTCSEDVPRITEEEIARETADTYLGDTRVREQQAACKQWPHKPVRDADVQPVRSSVPVFLLSGTIDPVTRPRFAADAARWLPNSIHVIAPGGHVPSGSCVDAMERQFLSTGSPRIDTSCTASMTLPAFRIK